MCFQKRAADGLPVPRLVDSLPAGAPTVALKSDDTWLKTTMLVVETYFLNDYRKTDAYEITTTNDSIFSQVVWTFL